MSVPLFSIGDVMKIVAISDLHGYIPRLPEEADMLIICGDLVPYGTRGEYTMLNNWLGNLPYKHKVVIAGNHDRHLFVTRHDVALTNIFTNATYLCNESTTIEGVKIWGSPYTPICHDWYFMKEDEDLYDIWDGIPADTDILVTHGPPYGILDMTLAKTHCGSIPLKHKVAQVRPKLHLFGHIHESYGQYHSDYTSYYNCSLVNRGYELVNKPVVIEYSRG